MLWFELENMADVVLFILDKSTHRFKSTLVSTYASGYFFYLDLTTGSKFGYDTDTKTSPNPAHT